MCLEGQRYDMRHRLLGQTGHRVALFSIGAQSMVEKDDSPEDHDDAIELLNEALDLGVNYIDTAPAYGPRISENRVGELSGRRNEFYLATKTDVRTNEGAWKQINQSLERLDTTPDCIQLHHLDTLAEVEKVFGKNGAMKALLRAKEEKLCKFVGITGHSDPTVLLEALRRHRFDTVLGAVNIADPYHYSFQTRLIPYCKQHGVGFIGMKVCGRGTAFVKNEVVMKDCLDYVWSVPGVGTAIVGVMNVEQLRHNVQLAKDHEMLDEAQMFALEQKAEPHVDRILHFRKHKDWLDVDQPQQVI